MRSTQLIKLCVATLIGISSFSAHAVEFIVDSTADAVDTSAGDGLCETAATTCTLRAAVQEANALAGDDTITIPPGIYKFSLAGNAEDLAATGDLDITSVITFNGAGADQVFIDAMELDRVFDIIYSNSPAILGEATINGVTIRNGVITGSGLGGGIKNRGVLVLNDSNVDRNQSIPGGGGIHAAFYGYPLTGRLEINRSVISNNDTQSQGAGLTIDNMPAVIRDSVIRDNWNSFSATAVMGGGIYHSSTTFPPVSLEIYNSTIYNNAVTNHGGGLYSIGGGAVTIVNSTFSGNAATSTTSGEGYGGGAFFFGDISNPANVTLTNVTLAYNSAGNGGGGIYLEDSNLAGGAAVTLTDTLLSANSGGDCLNADSGGSSTLTEAGTSLDSDSTCSVALAGVDPLLAVLNDNSGPGMTHALGTGSPAIDAAGACLTTDLRAFTRPASSCDIGAFEVEGIAPATAVVTPPANTGVSTNTSGNTTPVAYDLPAAVVAGGAVTSIMNASDADGDPLFYEFPLSGPVQGSVGRPTAGSADDTAQAFVYSALGSATGTDSFTYRACDAYGACSAPATINITIDSGSASSDVSVDVTQGTGNVNDLVVVSEASLSTVAPDIDYTYPLGGFFFTVDSIPTDSSGTATSVTVTIQLPASADLPANAEIRKLDTSGVWRTLGSTVSATLSTAVVDSAAKTITLTLVDNDIYDLDPAVGVVDDPIAIGVPVSTVTTSSGNSTTTATGGGGATGLSWWGLILLCAVTRRMSRNKR